MAEAGSRSRRFQDGPDQRVGGVATTERDVDRKAAARGLEPAGAQVRAVGACRIEPGDEGPARARLDEAEDRVGRPDRQHARGRDLLPPEKLHLKLVGGRPRRIADERLPDLGERPLRPPRERMARVDDDEPERRADLHGRHVRRHHGNVVHDDVGGARAEQRKRGLFGLVQIDGDVGPVALEPAQPGRQELADEQPSGVHRQSAAERLLPDRAHDGRKAFEERSHEGVQRPALRGQRHPVAGFADEQPRAELGLQLPHLLVHRGLGDGVGEGARRARVAAGPGHVEEAFQARELNRLHHEAELIANISINHVE